MSVSYLCLLPRITVSKDNTLLFKISLMQHLTPHINPGNK